MTGNLPLVASLLATPRPNPFRDSLRSSQLLMELSQGEMEDDLLMNSLDARFLKMATTFLNRMFSG